jgi:hypothetical protein
MRFEKQQDWAIEVVKKLVELRMTKKDVADILAMNYTQLCGTLSGCRISQIDKQRIINVVETLYRERFG